jgi:hypothetical protein
MHTHYNYLLDQLKSHRCVLTDANHYDMIQDRFHRSNLLDNLESVKTKFSSIFKELSYNLPRELSIIELGSSFGFLGLAEHQHFKNSDWKIKSWKGYDIDSRSITIANHVMHDLGLSDTYQYYCNSVSADDIDYRYTHETHIPLGMRASSHETDWFNIKVPNISCYDLPPCDVMLCDIEGDELDIDFAKINSKFFIIETNTTKTTQQFIEKILDSANSRLVMLNSIGSTNRNTGKRRKDKMEFMVAKI